MVRTILQRWGKTRQLLQRQYWRERRWWQSVAANRAVEELMLDMHECLLAGENMLQALRRSSEKESSNPLLNSIRSALLVHEKGLSLIGALNLNLNRQHRFVNLWLRAVELQLEFGADLRRVLAQIADMIANEEIARGELQGKTVEARWTAWILAASPLAFFLFFRLANPNLLEPLWQVDWGKWAVLFGFISWLLGIIVIRRLVGNIPMSPSHQRSNSEFVMMLDFMVLAAKSGMNLSQCIEALANPRGNSLEIRLYNISRELKQGMTVRQCLADWEASEKLPEVRRALRSLQTALSLGTPIAQTLERQAAYIRRSNRNKIDQRINALPLQLTICTMTLLFPPILVVVLLPPIINFMTFHW